MRALAILILTGCGRIGFGPVVGSDDATIDGALPSGLVVWFPFDEPDGVERFDDQITSTNGSCTPPGCPHGGNPGRLGTALLFDGVDDCVAVADAGQLSHAAITLALWANADRSGPQTQLAKLLGTANFDSWELEVDVLGTTNTFTFVTSEGTLNSFTTTAGGTIKLLQWQHLAATFDGTTKRVYIDGVELETQSGIAPILYDSGRMLVGCDNNGGTDVAFYQGAIDDLQIYNRALSATEIAALATP